MGGSKLEPTAFCGYELDDPSPWPVVYFGDSSTDLCFNVRCYSDRHKVDKVQKSLSNHVILIANKGKGGNFFPPFFIQ